MVQEDRRFFYLGMNQDNDPRYLKEGEYIEANNFYVSQTDNGNNGALENVKSTLKINALGDEGVISLPSGRNKCIKIQDDEENKRTYIFIWNSEGSHQIRYYKHTDKTLNVLIRDNNYSTVATLNGATPTFASTYSAGDVVRRTNGTLTDGFYICLIDIVGSFGGEKDPEKNTLLWKRIGDYLNFQENNFLDSGVIIRDSQTLLFWTDNHNEPKYINVDSFIDGDYPTAIEPEHIDLCPLQPLYQPHNDNLAPLTGSNNNIAGKYFQFRYRWVFDDDMYGAWSPISEMNTYNKNIFAATDDIDRDIPLRIYRNSAIESRLKKIEVCFRDCRNGNSGSWYKVKEIDAKDFTDVIYFTTGAGALGGFGSTGGGTQYESFYEFSFTNNSERIPLDQEEANELFSYVPRKAATLAITEDNRIVFGDITESIDVTDIELDMNASYNYGTASISTPKDAYLKTLKTGIKYKWGIRYSDAKGRLIPVLTDDDLEVAVDFYNASASYPSVVSLTMTINHSPPPEAASWQLCYLPIGVDYEGGTPLAYQFSVGADQKTIVYVGSERQAYASLQIPRTFNTDNADSNFPLDFSDEYYIRGVYENAGGGGGGADWADYDESKIIEVLDSGEIDSVQMISSGTGYTWATVTAIGGGGEGATFTANIASGSIVSISVTNSGSGYTSFPILQISGDGSDADAIIKKVNFKKYVKFDNSNWSADLTHLDIVEVYKKSNDSNGGIWYEFGYPCKIGRDSSANLVHIGVDSLISSDSPPAPTQNQTLSSTPLSYTATGQGDMYIAKITAYEDTVNFPPKKEGSNRVDNGDYYYELPFADIRTASRSTDIKRPLVAFTPKSIPTLNTTLRWSDPLLQNSNINGLGFFYGVNFRELNQAYGSVRKLLTENEYLKVFFDRKIARLPMGRSEITSLDGSNLISKTTDVFGTSMYSTQDFGVADNPESVSSFGGVSIFTDRNKNKILLTSGMDVKVISDLGMKYFFDKELNKTQRLLTKPFIQSVYNKEFSSFFVTINGQSISTGTGLEVDSETIYITLTGEQIDELILTESISLRVFSNGLYPIEVISADNWSRLGSTTLQITVAEADMYNGMSVDVIQGNQYTLNYSPSNSKWMSFFDLPTEYMGSAAVKMISSKDGEVYVHNEETVTDYNTFYGDKYNSHVIIPFAAEPLNAKNPRAIELESVDTNYNMEYGINERGQSTSLLNSDFENIEGRQWANILMDENTPLVGGITNPITQGDLMIGTYFKSKIVNTSSSLVRLFSSKLRYIKSLI